MTNSPTNHGTPSVTEKLPWQLKRAGRLAILNMDPSDVLSEEKAVAAYLAMQAAAPQHTGLTDVERVSLADVARKVAASFLDPVLAGETRRMMERGKLDDHIWVRIALAALLVSPYPSEQIDQTGYVYEPEDEAQYNKVSKPL